MKDTVRDAIIGIVIGFVLGALFMADASVSWVKKRCQETNNSAPASVPPPEATH